MRPVLLTGCDALRPAGLGRCGKYSTSVGQGPDPS